MQVLQNQRSLSNCTEGATKACCHQLYSSNQKRVTCIFVNLAVDNNINSNNIKFHTPWNDKVSVSFSKKQAYSCTLIYTYKNYVQIDNSNGVCVCVCVRVCVCVHVGVYR